MKDDVAISVKNVSKNFRLPHEKTSSLKSGIVGAFRKKDRSVETQHALKGISFDIKKGEFFGILGRNGSGKSTLLKILAEIYQPTGGSVGINGKLVPFIELGVGFNPELTGRENVYLNGALLGFSRKEIDARYDDIVAFAELEQFMDQKLKNYSSGMQVRLAFSVATRAEADILLVDEVLAVGDADFQRKCYDFFKSLKKSGKTVIFVTHDMGAVREYCDKGILISDGKVIHTGNANTIANEYLKMFNADDTSKTGSTSKLEKSRWGNGQIRVESASVKADIDNIEIVLRVQSKSSHDIEGVGVGLRILKEDELIAGTGTTRLLGGKSLTFKANERKILRYTSPNILGAGTYWIGATVQLADRVTVCDDWTGFAKISNTKIDSFYPILLPASLDLE